MLGEIVKRDHAGDNWRERRRNFHRSGVGKVLLAIDFIYMDGGVKGRLHTAGCAGELDDGAARRYAIHLKSVRSQPRGYGLDVRARGAELLAELGGGQPLVITGRRTGLLGVHQLPEGGFL